MLPVIVLLLPICLLIVVIITAVAITVELFRKNVREVRPQEPDRPTIIIRRNEPSSRTGNTPGIYDRPDLPPSRRVTL